MMAQSNFIDIITTHLSSSSSSRIPPKSPSKPLMPQRRQNQKRASIPSPQLPQTDGDDDGPNLDASPTSLTPSLSPQPQGAPTTITPQQTTPNAHSGDPSGPNSDAASDLVNMYFLLLGAFAIILAIGIWYWRRGKKRKQLESAGRRQNALEQDLEMGRQQGIGGSNRTGWLGLNRRGREEGVDERGEAPPPYTADDLPPAEGQAVAVPERVHVRVGGVLPKYEELRESPGRGSQPPRTLEGELLEPEPTPAEDGGRSISGPRTEESEEAGRASTSGIIRSRDDVVD